MSTPVKISILTATFNSSAVLRRLYASLEAQTYREFEWIVVDGRSSDATINLLTDWASRQSWIKFISEPDFGVYDALNKGLHRASGEYYLVVGSDDELNPEALRLYADAVADGDCDVVLANVLKDDRVAGGFCPSRGWLGHQQVFRGSHSVGMLFKKSLHDRYGDYSNRFPMLADGYFLKKLLRSPDVRFVQAGFVAGRFCTRGISSTGKLQSLAETWQIQMLTERNKMLQVLIFIAKIVLRLPRL
jgi:glycosyltransferase involved in cell wall biosynthesis